jgi:hypothetical protein
VLTSLRCPLQAGAEDAASALSPEAFAPTSRVTGIILPNPDNTTCWVLIGVKQIGTTPSIQVEPTASPVASSVRSILSLQVESLNQTAYVVMTLPSYPPLDTNFIPTHSG